jgi:hypothetical protein
MIINSRDLRDPLDVVAGKIRALWKKAEDQRLAAALLLVEAKERVEAGGDPRFAGFPAWCREQLPGQRSGYPPVTTDCECAGPGFDIG